MDVNIMKNKKNIYTYIVYVNYTLASEIHKSKL